jgi:multiple sugar transport system substrate-binding protein
MAETKDALGRSISRRSLLGNSALAGLGIAGGSSLLAACGGGSSGGPTGGSGGGDKGDAAAGTGGAVTWASWANPGEAERFRKVSKDYESKNKTKITFQIVTGDYNSKLLTQLAGGSAPDAFYVNTEGMSKMIESKNIVDLTEFTNKSDSPVKIKDFYPGLLTWCKPVGGEGVYGLPVDCNPLVFWFNKDLIAAAGITQSPVQQFEAGSWNRNALDDFLTKMKASGKRGLVLEGDWSYMLSWMTTFGGKPFDDKNKAVFDTEPKCLETLQWLWGHMKDETITYGGSLPKGQGVDALFYAQQLASCQMGRWILPNLKKLKFNYDIAPYPSEDGKTIAPVNIPVAAMGVNAKAKDQDAALWFTTRYVSVEGQKARLAGGGNAVPSIPGAEEIVTEGNLPEHASYWNDVAKVGYAIPQAISSKPAVATNIKSEIDKVVKSGADAKTFATKICNFINKG